MHQKDRQEYITISRNAYKKCNTICMQGLGYIKDYGWSEGNCVRKNVLDLTFNQ